VPAWAVVCAVAAFPICDLVKQDGAPAAEKTFKDDEPGFIHIDMKYRPQMLDESARRYLFVAIDRATRWVFIDIYADQSESSSAALLTKARAACPVKIVKLLTDNGSQFTDRFTAEAETRSPAASVCSTDCASNSISSTGLFRQVIRRQTAWSSVSMATSATSSIRLASAQLQNLTRRCAITSRSATTTFHSAR
jgi:hypothetical protein